MKEELKGVKGSYRFAEEVKKGRVMGVLFYFLHSTHYYKI
jgi:hypothetical protein